MPLYMYHHKKLEGLTAEAVAKDHKKDLEAQDNHEAKALKYWFSEEKGEVYCLFEASSAEAAEAPLFTEMPRRVLLGNRASGVAHL